MSDYANKLTALTTVTALPDAGAEYMKGDETVPSSNDVINRTSKENRAYIENLVDGAIGLNLLRNGDLEQWTAGTSSAPDDWTLSGTGATIARSTTKKYGSYSAAATYGSSGVNLYQDTAEYLYFQSRYVTMGAWVWCDVASIARLNISDGVGQSSSSYHTGGSTWEFLTVTRQIDASATFIRAACQVNGAGTGIFDMAKLEEGQLATAFTPFCITPYTAETLRNKTMVSPIVNSLTEQVSGGGIAISTAAPSSPPTANAMYKDNIVKAWAHVTVSGGVPTLQDSFNVSSISDDGTGLITFTWDRDFANAYYSCGLGAISGATAIIPNYYSAPLVGSAQIGTYDTSSTLVDVSGGIITVNAIGDQA